MTVEISLRRSFSLPRVLWAQHDDSRKEYHWIGQKPSVEKGQVNPGNQNRNQKSNKRNHVYRPLADITLGEVDDIYHHFEHQLLIGQESWVGKNYFCQIPLKRNEDGRPPVIFGHVGTMSAQSD